MKITINAETGCWEWTGYRFQDGYGGIKNGRSWRVAHRVLYELLVGRVPLGLQLDHLCRVRHCVNPQHLEPVTASENVRRGMGPTRSAERMLARTHCPAGHPYAGENLYLDPRGRRYCRTCNRAAAQAIRDRRRAMLAEIEAGP